MGGGIKRKAVNQPASSASASKLHRIEQQPSRSGQLVRYLPDHPIDLTQAEPHSGEPATRLSHRLQQHDWVSALVIHAKRTGFWNDHAVSAIPSLLRHQPQGQEELNSIHAMTLTDAPNGFTSFKISALQFVNQHVDAFKYRLIEQQVPYQYVTYLGYFKAIFLAQALSEHYLKRQLGQPLKLAMENPDLVPDDHIKNAIHNALDIGRTVLERTDPKLPNGAHLHEAKLAIFEAAGASVKAALNMLHQDNEVLRLMKLRFGQTFSDTKLNQCSDVKAIWELYRTAFQSGIHCLSATSVVHVKAIHDKEVSKSVSGIQRALCQLGRFRDQEQTGLQSWCKQLPLTAGIYDFFCPMSFPDLAATIKPAEAWSQNESWDSLGNFGTDAIHRYQVLTPRNCFLLFREFQKDAELKIEAKLQAIADATENRISWATIGICAAAGALMAKAFSTPWFRYRPHVYWG